MSTRDYYREYNASERGKERTRRQSMEPARKIYASLWQDANREKVREYNRRYHERQRLARGPVRVARPCATYACPGVCFRNHGRKFCDECRKAFGYTIRSNWYYRQKARNVDSANLPAAPEKGSDTEHLYKKTQRPGGVAYA